MVSGQRMLQLIPDAVKGMLAPGEVPLAYEMAQQFADADAVGKDAPTMRNSLSWNSSGMLDPTGGPIEVRDGFFEAKLAGLAAGGAHDSLGHRFSIALGEPSTTHLLLTTHRLAITGTEFEKLFGGQQRDGIYLSIERRAIRSIRLAPRLIQRGRVRFYFADGSWAMAMMGMFLNRAAKRLIAAHHG